MDELSEALIKAMQHCSTALRFHHDDQGADTDQEIKCAVNELAEQSDNIEVEFK